MLSPEQIQMVTVIDYKMTENSEGKEFIALILQGGVEAVKSESSGKFYLTARKCQIASTFNEVVSATMVGKELPGSINKVECEPYEYVVPETGEVIDLAHRWEYNPEEPSSMQHLLNKREHSSNGVLV